MPTKTKRKARELKVTNYDRNGNVIMDLSKIVISRERQIRLINKLNRNNGF